MAAITELRGALMAAQPEVEEVIGGCEFFADGAVVRFRADGLVTTVIHYQEQFTPTGVTRHEVVRIHFAYPVWQNAMDRTTDMLRRTIMRRGLQH